MKPGRVAWRPTGGYRPNSPFNGDDPNYIFRGLNQIIRGNGSLVYCENWRGVSDLSETVTATSLTGTVATTNGSATVTGTSTVFTREVVIGQQILISNQLYQVRAIASDTSLTISPAAGATASGLTAKLPHLMVDVDLYRGTLARGNVQRFAQGNLLAVGYGAVRLNGATIPSGGLSADKRLKLAVLDPATGNYSVYKLGMATPTLTTVVAQAGGVKNMQAGTYSVRITPARTATGGSNNPSAKVEVTIATGEKIKITFPAMDTTAGQDAWNVYGTLFSTGQGIQGPWYYVQQITTAYVASAGGDYSVEWNDAEISGNGLLEFDNDPPPDAGFIASLQGYPVLLSCNGTGRKLVGTAATSAGSGTVTGTSTVFQTDLAIGQIVYIDGKLYTVTAIASNTSITVSPAALGTASSLTIQLADTSPGPVVRPSKPNNPEAFPADFKVAVNPPENIIGVVEGGGRLFLMTENRLHMATLSGNSTSPVTVRPFWRAGFKTGQSLIFVNGQLYGYTTNGPTRSIADGDEGIMEHDFASPVASIMANWIAERVKVGVDPKNEAVCFFHANDNTNNSGYYYSTCLMYMLRLGVWSPLIVIESTSANMTVSGVGTVSGKLYLTISEKNYEWDSGAGTITGYIATPFVDLGENGYDKTVRGMAITAYSSSTISGSVFAAQALEDVPYIALQHGAPSDTVTISFAMGSDVRQSDWKRLNVRRGRLIAARVDFAWSGSGTLARLDEIMLDVSSRKNKY